LHKLQNSSLSCQRLKDLTALKKPNPEKPEPNRIDQMLKVK